MMGKILNPWRERYVQGPNRWTVAGLVKTVREGPREQPDLRGRWRPARPCGLDTISNRVRLAWAVLTGRADAVFWDWNDDNTEENS